MVGTLTDCDAEAPVDQGLRRSLPCLVCWACQGLKRHNMGSSLIRDAIPSDFIMPPTPKSHGPTSILPSTLVDQVPSPLVAAAMLGDPGPKPYFN